MMKLLKLNNGMVSIDSVQLEMLKEETRSILREAGTQDITLESSRDSVDFSLEKVLSFENFLKNRGVHPHTERKMVYLICVGRQIVWIFRLTLSLK